MIIFNKYLVLIFLLFCFFIKCFFKNNSNQNTKLLIFYTNWCKYSQQFFIKLWPKLKKFISIHNIEYILIDGDNIDTHILTKYNIKGYPSIIKQVNDKYTEYKGNINYQSILDFLLKEF